MGGLWAPRFLRYRKENRSSASSAPWPPRFLELPAPLLKLYIFLQVRIDVLFSQFLAQFTSMSSMFYISSCSIDTLGPPRGPAIVKWVKNSLELSWQPPSEVTITNDLQYIIEVEQNYGNWSTLGVSHEPRLLLLHLNAAKTHNFRIFVKNKVGTSEPLILEDVNIPLNHHGLAIEEVFDDNTTNNLGDGTFRIY